MVKIPDDLKMAIKAMPIKEKDKLLLRLIAKDELLVKKLNFQLMEAAMSVDERVEEIQKFILHTLRPVDYNTPGYLRMDLSSCNVRITEHVKVTKDKLGEVNLTILMLKTAFDNHLSMLENFPAYRSRTFTKYVITRIKQLFKKTEKLHEDYFMEFADDFQLVLDYVFRFSPTESLAKMEGIPRYFAE